MLWRRLLLVLALQVSLVAPAPAGIFFNRNKNKNNNKNTPNPAQRVPELIGILKSNQDENQRLAAVNELRQYDAKAHPEILPALMDLAQRDPQPEVRSEAVVSLSKTRPVSQEVGFVLEQVLATDSSTKVKWQARTALWQYQMAGYRNGKSDAPPLTGPTTAEPPLADPLPTPGQPRVVAPTPAPRVAPVPTPVPTPPPAAQMPANGYRPLPSAPARPPLVPAEAPQLQRPPSADGPSLFGPN